MRVHVVLPDGGEKILLTSLIDRRRFKAADVAACYRRRWEIETSYREVKQTMLGGPLTLRTQDPEGIIQEIWGALIAYNLVRLEMAMAATEAKAQPTDLSFIRALHTHPARTAVRLIHRGLWQHPRQAQAPA